MKKKIFQRTNKDIIVLIKSTAILLELHEANPFKVRHYSNAAFCVEQANEPLEKLSLEALKNLEGMSQSAAKLVHEINTTGTLQLWEELRTKTTQLVPELPKLRGIGAKTLSAIGKELGIRTLVDLLYACQEDSTYHYSGLREQIQKLIKEALPKKEPKHPTKLLYAKALPYATGLEVGLKKAFPSLLISLTGALRRKMEVIGQVEIIIGTDATTQVVLWLNQLPIIQQEAKLSGPFRWQGRFLENDLKLVILFCDRNVFYKHLILQTGSERHLALRVHKGKDLKQHLNSIPSQLDDEAIAYEQVGLPYIPPELREGMLELRWPHDNKTKLLEKKDLKGILHVHTTYSDGKHSLSEIAKYCKKQGYEYIGITDHSQSAGSAGGLSPRDVQRQHQEIAQLNKDLAPFKIFRGIESDILLEGSLDYEDEVLSSFDFVIASVHQGLEMEPRKATTRMIKAISNPFTTIIGHLTGRLLLQREGLSVDHQAVIDACAEYGVIIEINSNPWRLELDWRWVDYAISKNVWLSINPDAHEKEEIENVYYGMCVARKGGLMKQHTFNALSSNEVKQYFQHRRKRF